jgi:hypothetical protein
MQLQDAKAKLEQFRTLLGEDVHIHQAAENEILFVSSFEEKPMGCFAIIDPDNHAFIFQILHIDKIKPDYHSVVLEYLNYVNFPLPIGNWEMKLDEGTVRWRSGFYFRGDDLSLSLMQQVMSSCFYFVGETFRGILILSQGGTMDEAIDSIGESLGLGRKSNELE